MDTGFPALIPEPLQNPTTMEPPAIPSPTNLDTPPDTDTQINLIGTPPITEFP